MSLLLDTDILSALRRRSRNPSVVAWLESQRTADLHLSVVTIGEVERGIARQRDRDPAFARELADWLDKVLTWYGDRVLAVDTGTARRWGPALPAARAHERRSADRRHRA